MARLACARRAQVEVSQRVRRFEGTAAHMSVSPRQTRAPLGIAFLSTGGVAAARPSGCGPKSNGLWPSVTWPAERQGARAVSGNGTDEQRTYDRSAVDLEWEMGPAHPHEENEEQEQGLGLWHLLAPASVVGMGGSAERARTLLQRDPSRLAGYIDYVLASVRTKHVPSCRWTRCAAEARVGLDRARLTRSA